MRNNVLLLLNNEKELGELIENLRCNYRVYTAGGENDLLRPVDSVSIQLIICSVDLSAGAGYTICSQVNSRAHYEFGQPAPAELAICNEIQEDFIKNLNDCIFENMHNSALNVDLLARCMNMSRPTLYRRIKTATGQTPNELINLTRLAYAAGLLSSTDQKVFEIAARVGFSSQSSFGKAFIKQFGITPTEHQRHNKKIRAQRREAAH